MSLLVVGVSYRTAPVHLLERAVLGHDAVGKLLADLVQAPHVAEAVVLTTCNRVEVYAEVEKFHGGVRDVSELFARATGIEHAALAEHLYVKYEDQAVQHLFTVGAGLDSMVIGETQVLGQLRSAFQRAREHGSVGRSLGAALPHALRAGKRAHAETGIDRAGQSLVSIGLDLAAERLGSLAGRRALVVGAGSMSALAVATLRRAGVDDVAVVNRTVRHAEQLVPSAAALPMSHLSEQLRLADLVVCSTGATGTVLTADDVAAAMAERPRRPLFVLDVALPRDVEPAARSVPAVTLVDLELLGSVLDGERTAQDVDAARRIVTEEVGAFLSWQRSARVAPTVVALRAKAADVVDRELARLAGRLPDLDERSRAEVAATVRRVVDKLLHAPTVRVKELAEEPGGDSYADALRELFDLPPGAPDAVTRAAVTVEEDVP